ncbi:hypothetical protein BBJ29_008113 [Phytophthora kernoviae]|uniref:PWI domain-containing protein n=1 Tax=Phytophthora kernoviae TaxID=325452 RepID=A0A3F2RHM2_9STRA|nr:hypothetical protein BBP00_00007605 [Phytophthora kernoviae]RLN70099.1 hypothetical protein BBJ29_008113 [Phytophthora kernoviae]
MATYPKSYVFPFELTDAWKQEIMSKTRDQLTEMLGVEVDNVMAEYVIVMVGNKKNMEQIAHDLIDFIGEESAEQFVVWLSQLLPAFEAQAPVNEAAPVQTTETQDQETMQPPSQEALVQNAPSQKKEEAPPKRVISLKGLSMSSAEPKMKTVSLSSNRGTIRSLSSSKTNADDMMARRSQRFGAVEKSAAATKTPPSSERRDRHQREETRGGSAGNKRRASECDNAAGLSRRLGPPVNVDQAELDARDSLVSHKKKRGDRGDDRDRNHQSGGRNNRRNDRDHDMEDSGRNGKRRNNDSRDAAPPLPPSDDQDGDYKGKQRFDGRGMGPPMDGFQGGPMGYGGFPPPYGAPMFYPPPGYGPMNPYAMGFPPQGMPPPQYGGRSYPRPPAPGANGPRGRPFQNRKWVNPNVAKTEEGNANEPKPESDAGPSEASDAAPNAGLNTAAPTFAPRNPYFSSQMRPRFQNKTWVRQDPAKDEELNSSLPKTPPKELLESTE